MGQSGRECHGVRYRQEGRDLVNFDPETMQLLRKESPESLREESRISPLSYIGKKEEVNSRPLLGGRAQSARRQLVEFANLNSH